MVVFCYCRLLNDAIKKKNSYRCVKRWLFEKKSVNDLENSEKKRERKIILVFYCLSSKFLVFYCNVRVRRKIIVASSELEMDHPVRLERKCFLKSSPLKRHRDRATYILRKQLYRDLHRDNLLTGNWGLVERVGETLERKTATIRWPRWD